MKVTVERAGFLTTVQDLGRTNYRGNGVSLGGALDPFAMRVANLLVGNVQTAAGLEITAGTVRLRFDDDRLIAWCGGPFDARVEGTPLSAGRVARIAANERLQITPANSARAWLAISAGIDVPIVLESRSTDLRRGFGGLEGRALRDGDTLQLSKNSSSPTSGRLANWTAPNEWSNTRSIHHFLRFIPGAEASQFPPDILIEKTFTVSPDSDRMGVRLEGPIIERSMKDDLLSEPVAPGTIQIPPNGQPILLLGDCQTIGGYPKIAHVITVDLSAAAQLQPGDSVRFAEVSLGEAQQLLLERERDLDLFRVGLTLQSGWN